METIDKIVILIPLGLVLLGFIMLFTQPDLSHLTQTLTYHEIEWIKCFGYCELQPLPIKESCRNECDRELNQWQ